MRRFLMLGGCCLVVVTGGGVSAQATPFGTVASSIDRLLSGDRAFATVRYVEQFYRLPGNRGFDASIDSVARLLVAAGFVAEDRAAATNRLVYRIESRPMTGMAWSPNDASVMLAGETTPLISWATNHNMLASNSWSTPPGGVDAEIVDVGAGTDADLAKSDVKGKIVFSLAPPRGLLAKALKAGAIGTLVTQKLPAYNQQEKNPTAINFSSVPFDSLNKGWQIFLSSTARDRLRAALARGPVRARVNVATLIEWRPERTLIAEIRGSKAPSERFVYSAHVQEPGANDNASGVGALAEMARVAAALVKSGAIDPARTTTFLWGNEIQATRRFIVEDSARREGIKWGMSLDMVGENTALTGGAFLIERMPDPGAVWVRGEEQHTEWGGQILTADRIWPHWFNDFVKQRCIDRSVSTGGKWVVKANPYEGGSDHTPFVNAKIPGLLMWHFTDQFYHDDLDRLEMVSPITLANVGNCALTTGLVLVSGKREYAVAAAQELAGIAERRLEAEAVLSRDALKRADADLTKERTILEAWRDYYVGALAQIPEMTFPHDDLAAEVAAGQERVKRKAAQMLGSIAPRKPE